MNSYGLSVTANYFMFKFRLSRLKCIPQTTMLANCMLKHAYGMYTQSNICTSLVTIACKVHFVLDLCAQSAWT